MTTRLTRSMRVSGPTISITAAAALAAAACAAPAQAAASSSGAAAHSAYAAASSGWRVMRDFLTPNVSLLALSAVSDSNAWAGGVSAAQTPVVYHQTGGTWLKYSLPGTAGMFVNSLSATKGTNVWASIANQSGGAVERLTRHGWQTYTFPQGKAQIADDGVITFGATNTWVFEYDFATMIEYAYHYTGHWSRHVMPAAVDANSDEGLVSGSSSSNLWALTFAKNQPASMWYNGKKWQVIAFPGNLAPKGTTLNSKQILAVSPTSVWATISTFTAKGVGPVVLLHWDGHKWNKVTGKLPAGNLLGPLASDGHGGVWLFAENLAQTKAVLLHYSGGHWSSDNDPTTGGKAVSVSALDLIPGTRSVLGTGPIAPTPGGNFGSAVIKYGR
jgi:hypothetical protein